jgi:type IX secretion system PorP/SprF family membrane protein
MRNYITKYIVIFLIAFSANSFAQQFPIYSQYWTNKFLLNPAVAGHEGYTSINLTARKQWAGLEGSPGTVAISGQTRILRQSHISGRRSPRKRRRTMSRSGRVGVGGYVFSDNLGALNKMGFQGTYSYHLDLRSAQLSFGASLQSLQFRIDKSKIQLEDISDALINSTSDRGYVIDANFGAYLSTKNFYAGFSTQNLFESYFKLNNREGSDIKMERQYLLLSGYRYDIIDFVYLEPSFNFKLSENVVSQLDLNLTCYFKESYWGGLAYRTGSGSKIATETLGGRGASLILYGGARIDKFFFGYSIDYTLSSIQKYSYGSHEVMIAVKFGDNARRYRWLNRY